MFKLDGMEIVQNAYAKAKAEKLARDYSRKVKQKRIITTIVSFGLSVIFGFTSAMVLRAKANGNENLYAIMTICTDIDYTTDTVTVVDFNGFEWQFNGVEDYDTKDIICLVMNDKGTELIFDDEIVSTKYDGWLGSGGWSEEYYVD